MSLAEASVSARSLWLPLLGAVIATTCGPSPRTPRGAGPPAVVSAQPMLLEAGTPTSDSGVNDGMLDGEVAVEVSLERLIAQPATYAGQRVTTAGWVVSCDIAIACGTYCGRCALCSSRAAFVPPGTEKMAPCERNGHSLIIMDLDALSRYPCHSTSCTDACFRTCPFPARTSVRLTGTIKHAEAESQIGLGEDQWVFDLDPM